MRRAIAIVSVVGMVTATAALPAAQTTDERTGDDLVTAAEQLHAALKAEEETIAELLKERRRLEMELLELKLAEVRDLIREGRKADAAAAMEAYERGMAHFQLAHVAWEHFPSKNRPQTKTESFRGEDYIGVLVSRGVDVYNSLRLDQPGRVRHLLNDRLLTLIKEFAQAAEGASTYGLLISLKIPYRNLVADDQGVQYDTLRLYLPMAEIKRFADYEITSQDLLDASVVIVNDNRIAVTLG